MEQTPVTMSQIAQAAGVHVSTVSLALRDSPLLKPDTRERIQDLAKTLGYVRDPGLSALIAYRSRKRVPAYQGTIAWLNGSTHREYVKTLPTVAEYLAGAQERAKELGYQLEEVWLFEQGLTPEGLRRRLQARGIRGVLVFPLIAPTAIQDFSWADFSTVTLGYSLTAPALHRATTHQFHTMLTVLRELCHLGYRKIGLSLLDENDRRFNLAYSSVYGAYVCRQPAEQRVPIHFQAGWDDAEGFAAWWRQERPEVVVTHNLNAVAWIEKLGLRIPEEVGLVFVNLPKTEKHLTGVYQNDHQVGRSAIELLVNNLHRNDRGIPQVAKHVLVDGVWLPGKTTRQAGPAVPWMLDVPIHDPTLIPLHAKIPRAGK